MPVLWVVLGIVVLLVLAGVVAYNRFVSQKQLIKDAWANIDTELRRRYDLIPNIVASRERFEVYRRGGAPMARILRVPLEHDLPPARDRQEPRPHRPREPAVVRHQGRAGVMRQNFGLQLLLSGNVQVVGGLVQQIEIGLGQPQRQQSQPRPLARR